MAELNTQLSGLPDQELELLLLHLYGEQAVEAEVKKLLQEQPDLKRVLEELGKEKEAHAFANLQEHQAFLKQQQAAWSSTLRDIVEMYPDRHATRTFKPKLAILYVAAAAVIALLVWVFLPTDPPTKDQLFATHILNNHLDPFEAGNVIVRGQPSQQDSLSSVFLEIEQAYKSGKYAEACERMRAGLQTVHSTPISLYQAGFICLFTDPLASVAAFSQIVRDKISDLQGPALLLLGWAYMENGRMTKAIACWDEITSNADSYPASLVRSARALSEIFEAQEQQKQYPTNEE